MSSPEPDESDHQPSPSPPSRPSLRPLRRKKEASRITSDSAPERGLKVMRSKYGGRSRRSSHFTKELAELYKRDPSPVAPELNLECSEGQQEPESLWAALSVLEPFMPQQYEYKIDKMTLLDEKKQKAEQESGEAIDSCWFHAVVRFKFETEDDTKAWMGQFELNTNTKWNKSRGADRNDPNNKGSRIVYRQNYECHRSNKNKVQEYQNSNWKAKNLHCTSRIYMKIRRDYPSAKLKDPHYGYFGEAVIHWTHNHSLQSPDDLRFLRDPSLKKVFEDEYFSKGLTAAEAVRRHKEYVSTLPDFMPDWLENRRICPDIRSAWHWFDEWRRNRYEVHEDMEDTEMPYRNRVVDLGNRAATLIQENISQFTEELEQQELDTIEEFVTKLERCRTRENMFGLMTASLSAPEPKRRKTASFYRDAQSVSPRRKPKSKWRGLAPDDTFALSY